MGFLSVPPKADKETEPEKQSGVDVQSLSPLVPKKSVGLTGRVILFLAGVAAAIVMVVAGIHMIGIQSQASYEGNETITEVFYHAMGLGFIGLGILGGGLLVGLSLKD